MNHAWLKIKRQSKFFERLFLEKKLCLLWYFYLSYRSSVAAIQTGVVVGQMGDDAG
jgi:hypothetical protein